MYCIEKNCEKVLTNGAYKKCYSCNIKDKTNKCSKCSKKCKPPYTKCFTCSMVSKTNTCKCGKKIDSKYKACFDCNQVVTDEDMHLPQTESFLDSKFTCQFCNQTGKVKHMGETTDCPLKCAIK